jgi:hypothetical protein
MSANPAFDPESDVLSVVGHFPRPETTGEMWGAEPGFYKLQREGVDSDFWSFHLKIDQAYMDTVQNILFDTGWPESAHGMHMYRFGIGTGWTDAVTENLGGKYFPNNENRVLYLKNMTGDTTLAWKYWNDIPPGEAGEDTVNVTFRTDLTRAINENGFSIGDTLIVRWGYDFTATFEEDTLDNIVLTNTYEKTVEVKNVALGADVVYQYYVVQDGVDYREIFFDFDDPDTDTQEERKVFIPDPKPTVVVVEDIIDSDTDLHRMPRFRNTRTLSQDVLVTYTCDLRPPYYQVMLEEDTIQNIQGESRWVYPGQQDSIFVWGVYINGPGNGTSGWQGWNSTALAEYMMVDDGTTNGDMTAGDSIYTFQVLFSPDSNDVIGQEFKFGIGAGDNEGGNTGFGLNHIENIDDGQAQFTIHSDFGSINPGFYWRWDFLNHVVGIEDQPVAVIKTPHLSANYPNPFNPVTTINFALPKIMEVDLVIYDLLGRKVRTLLSGNQQAGAHKVLWNGTDDRGKVVSSGIYYYRLTTENYNKTMKMVLMK